MTSHPNFDPEQRAIRKAILLDPDTFATCLLAIVLEMYGPESMEWEEETIAEELSGDFAIREFPEGQMDKLFALRAAISSNSFVLDPQAFEMVCETLSGSTADPEEFPSEEVLPGELAWGVVEVLMNRPEARVFSEEVGAYVGVVLDYNGISVPFQPLGMAVMPESSVDTSAFETQQSSGNLDVAIRFLEEQMAALLEQLSKVKAWDKLRESIVGMISGNVFSTTHADIAEEPTLG